MIHTVALAALLFFFFTAMNAMAEITGRVYVHGLVVNAELVRSGNAWVYRRYANDRSLYQLDEQAKTNKRGLWGLPGRARAPLGMAARAAIRHNTAQHQPRPSPLWV